MVHINIKTVGVSMMIDILGVDIFVKKDVDIAFIVYVNIVYHPNTFWIKLI